ncbi:nucleotide exchange factor GrpE [Ancylomarina sp. DW003]|nr:nucleotide exchange factor GrpE [Ancylomarina sp. DW003]MDE5420813.1 nucleotide exchange factor GrpE [Ancylomarina sp. DW003]
MTKDKSKVDKEDLEVKDTVTPETEEKVAEKEVKAEKKKSKKEKKADEIEELGAKLQEINDKYMRLSAEFDNYRKRTLKEKMELAKSGGEKILVNVLPVMDNFERALKSVDESTDIEGVKEGIKLIYTNFKDFMTQQGVKEIEATNLDFDTDVHEAITKIPAPTEELKGKVVDCIEKGYFLNEKVIRFSKVVVGE